MYNIEITPEVLKKHKINAEEWQKIKNLLTRTPNLVELGIFSAMWSEHCSYKSTRKHLKKMFTQGSQVICGPGENAGVIDVLDGDACVFKMESHNHPSFIEPFNGAATGVGGILRDVFTMGAKPIANVNSLRFGDKTHPRTKELTEGVVSGISFYGNCVGVPMVSGQTGFDSSYNGNILVNAMSVGIAKKDKIFYSAASKVGSKVIYFGSKTGRDGIHGASMSSDSFDGEATKNKPTVQVGDPFAEKLLIEACLELMEKGCVLAIQDMGAAGLTCSSVEMAGKGGTGIEIDISKVPIREEHMNAYEVMLSESQERMLMVSIDGKEDLAEQILQKWNLDFAIIGEITNTGKIIIKENGNIVCDLPLNILSEEAPLYERPFEFSKDESTPDLKLPPLSEFENILSKILSSPNILPKDYIFERYDRGVQNKVVFGCGQNSGVVAFGEPFEVEVLSEADKNYTLSQIMLSKGSNTGCSAFDFSLGGDKNSTITYKTSKALAITSSCTPRYVASDALNGAKQAVCEVYRNICSVGAKPLAITNCLNFGNPENKTVMGQIILAIDGISEAAKALDMPVVSGNVSLYNETNGISIKPTPTIGGVGLLKDYFLSATKDFKTEGDFIFLIGESKDTLHNSIFSEVILNQVGGKMPQIDLSLELTNGNFVRSIIQKGFTSAVNDVGSGGLAVCLNAMAQSGIGAVITLEEKQNIYQFLFCESQARYVVCIPKESAQKFISFAIESAIVFSQLGFCGGKEVKYIF